jgi:hypothetical protein
MERPAIDRPGLGLNQAPRHEARAYSGLIRLRDSDLGAVPTMN